MAINPSDYCLSAHEQALIGRLLVGVGPNPSLEQIWLLMDQAWHRHGCDHSALDQVRLSSFYRDPIWLLNGMFIEQDAVSMGHRHAITTAVKALAPRQLVDCGGGFGTLARLLAAALPDAEIAICDPYPPEHGTKSCRSFPNIRFVPELRPDTYDVLVSTDVLEHVPDPLSLLSEMVASVRPGGHLVIANCFYPVIACHLPSTFHLRNSFDAFCQVLGLDVLGSCEGSHATIYRRSMVLDPDWPRLRAMERRSKILFAWREWKSRHLSPWRRRMMLCVADPYHYPRKLLRALEPNR